jgi:hypothetical protein
MFVAHVNLLIIALIGAVMIIVAAAYVHKMQATDNNRYLSLDKPLWQKSRDEWE